MKKKCIMAGAATLAVAAPDEATSDPNQPKGSVYVYRKSGSTYAREFRSTCRRAGTAARTAATRRAAPPR